MRDPAELFTEATKAQMTANPMPADLPDRARALAAEFHQARRRRYRRRAGAIVATTLVIATGATVAATWTGHQSQTPEIGALCRSSIDPSSPMWALRAGDDPIEGCSDLWQSGVLPDPASPIGPGQPVPPLVACIGVGGAVEVYPGPADLCSAIGLDPADPVLDATNSAIAELSRHIAEEVNLAGCMSADEADAHIRALLDDLGLAGWEVVRLPDAATAECVTAGVDSASASVIIAGD